MIFISYRRSDSIGVVGRLCDRLRTSFGRDSLFLDYDSVPLGIDFREHVNGAIRDSEVVLVMIGPGWLKSTLEGVRRLDLPNDPVRMEIEIALNLGKETVPVLLGQAEMPRETDLPPSIGALADRNAARIDPGPDFDHHVSQLIAVLSAKLGTGPASRSEGQDTPAGSLVPFRVKVVASNLDLYVSTSGLQTDLTWEILVQNNLSVPLAVRALSWMSSLGRGDLLDTVPRDTPATIRFSPRQAVTSARTLSCTALPGTLEPVCTIRITQILGALADTAVALERYDIGGFLDTVDRLPLKEGLLPKWPEFDPAGYPEIDGYRASYIQRGSRNVEMRSTWRCALTLTTEPASTKTELVLFGGAAHRPFLWTGRGRRLVTPGVFLDLAGHLRYCATDGVVELFGSPAAVIDIRPASDRLRATCIDVKGQSESTELRCHFAIPNASSFRAMLAQRDDQPGPEYAISVPQRP